RLIGSHQRFSVLVAKYGATTNVSRPERHSRYRYSFVDVRRSALRRSQIGVKLTCSGSWTKRAGGARGIPAARAVNGLLFRCLGCWCLDDIGMSAAGGSLHAGRREDGAFGPSPKGSVHRSSQWWAGCETTLTPPNLKPANSISCNPATR